MRPWIDRKSTTSGDTPTRLLLVVWLRPLWFLVYRVIIIVRIIYVLPMESFFTIGRCGRVSHAIGVADTLAEQGTDVTVISGPQTGEHIRHAKVIEVKRGDARSWYAAMSAELDRLLEDKPEQTTAVIVRYRVSNAVRFISRMRNRHPSRAWCFEVNSLAYHQYPGLPGPIRRLVLSIEARLVGQADCSYLISDVLRQDIEPRVRDGHRCLVVPNGGPAPVQLSPSAPDAVFRFVFFGMLHHYNHLDVMIDGFLHARGQGLDAELHIYGDGEKFSQVVGMAKQDVNIHVHGRYNLNELLNSDLTDSACVLLLPFGDSEGLNRVQSPIKLFEYMATGLPIIASDMSQVRVTLNNSNSAMLVDPRSAEAWGEAMLELKSSASARAAMSREIRKSYPLYTWEHRVVQLQEGLKKLFLEPVGI